MALQAIPGVQYTPSPTKVPTPQNYISDSEYNLLTQYIPELEAQISDGYGSQMVTGMIAALGKESPFQADLIKWNEEGRLDQLATGVARTGNVFTTAAHTFRENDTIVVRDATGAVLRKGQVTATTTGGFTALCGNDLGWTLVGTTGLVVYTFSNEYAKGSEFVGGGLTSQVKQYTQKPIIIREIIEESRSNLALRTWVDTGSGFLWYFKNLEDTKKRFDNKIENQLILGENWGGDLAAAGVQGSEGLFAAAEEGNVFAGPVVDLNDRDELIDRLNAQGHISENYEYATSAQNRLTDRMLQAENVTGSSWGAFDNKETGIKLGFKDFNYGNYNFYKSNWRFLDHVTGEGSAVGATKVHGILIPSASKKVYDIMEGKEATVPMLHVKYRASQSVNRKYEMTVRDWATGTNRKDVRETEFLTEKALMVSGRNNLVIYKG
jgi:hypothetical protein